MTQMEISSIGELKPTSILDEQLRRSGWPKFIAECLVMVGGQSAGWLLMQASRVPDLESHNTILTASLLMLIFNWGWMLNNFRKGVQKITSREPSKSLALQDFDDDPNWIAPYPDP